MSDNAFPSDMLMTTLKQVLTLAHAVTMDSAIDAEMRSHAANIITDFLELSREVMELASFGFAELAVSNMREAEEARA